jgi:cytoskeletal protein CcmA (bactofilin family)
MFEKFSQKSMSATSEKFDTIIGRTTTIQGTLILRDSVRIDGKVLGNIEADGDSKITVAVGPTGEIKGDIKAHRVMVAGKVAGHIHAAERVEFQKDSVVQGDVSYGSIAVEHGAKLSGLIIQGQVLDQSATGAQAAIQSAQSAKHSPES